MGLTHTFHSDKVDSSDNTLIQPSHWNADHVFETPAGINPGGIGMLHGIDNGLDQMEIGAISSTSRFQYLRSNAHNSVYEFTNPHYYFASDFIFAIVINQVITGGISNTVTLAPVPIGVNGTDTDHWIYIENEPVLITGGTAVSGAASGTLTFTPVNNHTSGQALTSATIGVSECIWQMTNGGRIMLPTGAWYIHAPIRRRSSMSIFVSGQGQECTNLTMGWDFPLTARGLFDWSGPGNTPQTPVLGVGGISQMSLWFIQPDSSDVSTYTHWPPAFYASGGVNGGITHPSITDVDIYNAWDGIKFNNGTGGPVNGATFKNIRASIHHRLFDLDNCFDTVRIKNVQVSNFGLTGGNMDLFLATTCTAIAFYVGRVDDLRIMSCTTYTRFCDLHTGSDGSGSSGVIDSCWADRGGFVMTDGIIRVIGGSIGGSFVADHSVYYGGGQLRFTGTMITNSVGYASVYAVPTNGNKGTAAIVYPAKLQLTGCHLHNLNGDTVQPVVCSPQAPYTGIFTVQLISNWFDRFPSTNYVKATIHIENNTGDTRAQIIGNVFMDLAGGNNVAIALNEDNYHIVALNTGDGHQTISLGGSAVKRVVVNNCGF